MKTLRKDNVVLFHKKNYEPIEWQSVPQVCKLLQGHISSAMQSKVRLKKIASSCHLNANTVSKIGYGITKEPRASTCLVLLRYFGYRVMLH